MNKLKGLMSNYRFLLFITGSIYIVLSLIAKKYIDKNIINSIITFACFSIVKGLVEIFNFNSLKSRVIKGYELVIIIGIFEVLIGMNLLIFTNLDENILRVIFGVWILVDSFINFLTLNVAREIHIYYYWISKLVYMTGIIIGLLILFNVLIINLNVLISNYFILFGIVKLLGSVINKKYIYSVK